MPQANPETIIEQFEQAAKDHAFKGSMMPEDWGDIILTYHRKKAALYKLVGLTYVIPEDDN